MPSHKIVVVEDDPDLREALVRQFRAEQFDVFAAHNGRDGASRVLQVRPSLIVLDLLMPDVDGHEMMQELIKQHPWVRQVPVLVVTNYGFGDKPIEDWAEYMKLEYLIKSECSLEDIVDKAKSLLS